MAVEVLFLVRHGKAQENHPRGDRYRTLSDEGRRRIASVVPRAQERGMVADLVLASPYPRALETRDLFSSILGEPRREVSEGFTPFGTVFEAVGELRDWGEAGLPRIAVFTHNPFVTELADHLLVPGALPDLVFHTPTVLALAFDQGFGPRLGRPLWILHP